MGEILPDGSIQGYSGYCQICKTTISTNMQGNELGSHECAVKESKQSDKPQTEEPGERESHHFYERLRIDLMAYEEFRYTPECWIDCGEEQSQETINAYINHLKRLSHDKARK